MRRQEAAAYPAACPCLAIHIGIWRPAPGPAGQLPARESKIALPGAPAHRRRGAQSGVPWRVEHLMYNGAGTGHPPARGPRLLPQHRRFSSTRAAGRRGDDFNAGNLSRKAAMLGISIDAASRHRPQIPAPREHRDAARRSAAQVKLHPAMHQAPRSPASPRRAPMRRAEHRRAAFDHGPGARPAGFSSTATRPLPAPMPPRRAPRSVLEGGMRPIPCPSIRSSRSA